MSVVKNSPEQIKQAMVALADFAGARRYELTELEMKMWLAFVERVEVASFMRFLSVWGMREKFMPTPSDAAKALGIIVTPEQAFETAYRQVKAVGPYNTPQLDAALTQPVILMGGWARFCEDAPDQSSEFAFPQFRKRFLEMYGQAQAQVEVQGITPQKVLGLEDASRERRGLPLLENTTTSPERLPAPRP